MTVVHVAALNFDGDVMFMCHAFLSGLLFPYHFIRPASGNMNYFCEHHSGRLSVITPLSDLQKCMILHIGGVVVGCGVYFCAYS